MKITLEKIIITRNVTYNDAILASIGTFDIHTVNPINFGLPKAARQLIKM